MLQLYSSIRHVVIQNCYHTTTTKMLELHDWYDFSITSWYPVFKDVAITSIIFQISPKVMMAIRKEDATEATIVKACRFVELNELKSSIEELDNAVFVKNNWHAPMDAKPFSFQHELKVTCVNDLLFYFSCSNVSSDFENTLYDNFCIVLKPYINIHPASEFRCVVINDILYGITNRDWPTYYSHFDEEGHAIVNELLQFFQQHVQYKFSRKTYTFDVVRSNSNEIKIMDFGPLNVKTNLYAFQWSEIQKIILKGSTEQVAPVFRYLMSDLGIVSKAEALEKLSAQMDKN